MGQAKSKTLHASAHDRKVHEETAKAPADPKKASEWMKAQLSKSASPPATTKAGAAAALHAGVSKAGDKALANGVKLMKTLQSKKHDLHSELKMSKHDEAEHAASKKAKVAPADEAKWLKQQLHESKQTAAKKLALKKAKAAAGGSHASKQQQLIKWAEAHGLPKALADNPKDKQKVKDIIARMKADAVVERIKDQTKQDDSMVKTVVHSADPSAAGDV